MIEERSRSPEFNPLAVGVDLAPLPEYKSAATGGFDFAGLLAKPLRLHEDLTSGCGGQTWPAGMVLAKHMLRYHQKNLRESRMWVCEDCAQCAVTAAWRAVVLRIFSTDFPVFTV